MSVPLRWMAGTAAAAIVGAVLGSYRGEIAELRRHAKAGGRMAQTNAGSIEYAVAGSGPPALVIHGAGGGYDQGLLLGRSFPDFQIIAPSRFGYLGTPTPSQISAATQADAHAALLNKLGIDRAVICGVSAGAPSAVELALRHPNRVRALVLIVPRGYSSERAEEAPPPNEQVMRLVMSGADLVWWLAMRLARGKVVQFLGVPPEIEARASAAERQRVDEIMKSILPLSMRIEGIRNEAAITLDPLPLERIPRSEWRGTRNCSGLAEGAGQPEPSSGRHYGSFVPGADVRAPVHRYRYGMPPRLICPEKVTGFDAQIDNHPGRRRRRFQPAHVCR